MIFGLPLVFIAIGQFPVWSLLMFGSLPFAIKLCRFIGTHHHQPHRRSELQIYCGGSAFLEWSIDGAWILGGGLSSEAKLTDALDSRYEFAFERYDRPFKVPLQTHHGEWSTRPGIFVYLRQASGDVGVGEISPPSLVWDCIDRRGDRLLLVIASTA